MQVISPNLFIYSGLLFIILELLTGAATGFDLFLAGVALLLGGGTFILLKTLWSAVITTTLVITIYFLLFRGMLRDKLISTTTHKINIDKLVGAKGTVIKNISSQKAGQVKIEGEIWRAISNTDLKKGEIVIVDSIEGVTLKVKSLV